jgi:hypothetical protein
MKNISFSLTTPQYKARTKTVTRRLGWDKLKAGDVLMGVEKGMGLKKGEKVKRLGPIRVKGVSCERLQSLVDPVYGLKEAALEGFPWLDGPDFIDFFCKANHCTPETWVTRIEFEYL